MKLCRGPPVTTTLGAGVPPLLIQGTGAFGGARIGPRSKENARGGHDIYENKWTYLRFGRIVRIDILLMINDLQASSRSGAEIPGELNFREGPTMLLRIKENRTDNLDGPTMSFKTKDIDF